MNANKPLVIYHGNCIDGFAAAWVFRLHFGAGNVDFHAGVYQDPPPDVTDRHVFLVDFSYKRPVLNQMMDVARTITVIDHHKSAQQDLAGLKYAIFDMDRSGAVLAWAYCFPDDPVPQLLLHIQDRDLWQFKIPRTREIIAALFSYPYSFDIWDNLIPNEEGLQAGELDRLAQDGEAIERKHHKDVAELVAASTRRMLVGSNQVFAANVPYTLSSDAGHLLMEMGSPFGVCYFDTPQGRTFSLRSSDAGPDVSEIAKLYGGGGHRNAAGFRVPFVELAQFEIDA